MVHDTENIIKVTKGVQLVRLAMLTTAHFGNNQTLAINRLSLLRITLTEWLC